MIESLIMLADEMLDGKTGGKLKSICDICICVPETETFKVQELHLPVYHYLCARVEKEIFIGV